jgi:mRNA interferase MazF
MQPSVMALTDKTPQRGEIWLIDLNPGIGHEQKGKRPALIISDNSFNETRAGMVIVLPITSKDKGISLHVPLTPEKTGLNVKSLDPD